MSENYDLGVGDYLKSPDLTPGAIQHVPAPMAVPALKLSVGDAIQSKPDYEAELRRASVATGVPLDTARADPKSTLAQAKVLSLNLDGLAETNPHTASFLTDPNNAAIAHDDTGPLAGVEQVLKNLGNLGKASFFAAASGGVGYLQAMSPTLRSLGINTDMGMGEFDDPKSPMGQYMTALRHASKDAATHFTPQTDNPWAAGVNNGVVNLFQAAPITTAAVLTKNPTLAVGAFGALAGGEGYGDALDAGKDEGTARRYAGTQGAIAMLAQAIPLHQLLGDVAEGTGFFKTLGKNILLSQPTMQAQTLAADFDRWQTLNPDKPVSEFLKERGPAAINTLVMTAVGDVANTSAAHAVSKLGALASSDGENSGKAVQAQQAGVILQQLSEAAKASKLRDRDPQVFHDFVAKATADGPVDTLYVDPRKITDALAQGDPQRLAGDTAILQSMPSVLPQMDEAMRTGQDVEIPTSEFTAYAAGSDLAQDLIPHLKTDPNGMSLAESQAFLQSHAEELKAQVQKIVKESGADDATQAGVEKVRQSILGELTTANRFTPDVNDAYSHLTAAFYATQAHRLGMTPEELHAQYPLKVAAEDVSGEALNQEKPGYDPGLGFKSKLAEAVGKGPGKAPAAQWEATLRNTPGLKKEELEWTGLPEFLAAHDGPVSKEDVQAFVAQRGVRLEEKVLGAEHEPSDDEVSAMHDELAAKEADNLLDHYPDMTEEDAHEVARDHVTWSDARQALASEREARGEEPKFEDYKLPGGTNYREVLLTLPQAWERPTGLKDGDTGEPIKGLTNPQLKSNFQSGHWDTPNILAHTRLTDRTTPDGKKVLFVEEVQSDWHQAGRDKGYAVPASPEEQAAAKAVSAKASAELATTFDELRNKYAPVVDEAARAMQVRVDAAKAVRDAAKAAWEDYTKPYERDGYENNWAFHPDVPADAADARRALYEHFLNVQSRWATLDRNAQDFYQAKHGAFEFGDNPLLHRAQRLSVILSRMSAQDNAHDAMGIHEDAARLSEARLKVTEASNAYIATTGEKGIPNAPFKTSWPALVMKRILQHAVEGGFDKVAWTTGEQQNERYNLGESLGGELVGQKLGEDQYYVSAPSSRAMDVVRQQIGESPYTKAQLTEVFGAEITKKLTDAADVAPPDKGAFDPRAVNGEVRLEGHDLRVGGEGMKGFYDRNLVNITNDMIKKLGGKVAPTAVAGGRDVGWASGETILRAQGVPEDDISERWHVMTTNERHEAEMAYRVRHSGMTQPGFEITPEMREAVRGGLALFQGEGTPRGSFTPDQNLIALLKGADLSTYLHESGHFYLETLGRIAAEHPDSEIAQDMDKALAFMGHKGKTAAEWLALPLDERREGHELFARGFEAYLMEGKAPSQELRGVFQRFRSWLVSVYKSVAGLNVSLTDDVRGVFDRMLASDQQIEDHQTALGFAPLFKDAAAAGMNPQEWAAYQRLGADATASAVDQLETRSIRDMKWASGAKDRAVARLQREAATKRKAMTSEVTAEVMAEPINRARQLLKFGLLDGQEQEGNTKLSLPALREMYGEGGTPLEEATGQNKPAVPYRDLGFGKYGMLAEDGVHPDHVAELLGFSSGDELVRQLLTAEPAKVTIEGKTDQRMLERYGDLVDRDSINKAADEAVHNDARLRFVATEANALAKATGGKRVLAEAAKGYADNMVGAVKVRELRPVKYQVAESRAAKAAEKAAAKGDLVLAATEKRNQVINGYAARAAQDAQAEIGKAVRYFAKFASAGTRKALDPDYRDQIDSLLERFDLSKNTTLRAIDKRKSLVAWVARMAENDIEPMIPEDLLNEAYRKSYKDMSVDEVRGLRDTVRQIEHLARLKNKLLAAKDARQFADVIEETTSEVEKNAIGKPRDLTESNQIGDKVEAGMRGFAVMHRKFDSLITRLAGFVDKRDPGNASTLWSVLVRPKNEAADREATRLQRSTEELQRIFKALAPDRVRQKVFIPEINNSLSLEGRLAVLLNWGNETSRQRVVDGDHWNEAQVAAIFKTLEPRHFKFAQDLIDHVESFKGEVAAAHKRRYGIEPPMIEASPFEAVASDGSTVQMKGGYYPIKYDPNRSAKAADFDVIKETKRAIVGSTKGFVKAGFYKARQDTVENRPVSKSFNAAFSHLTEVIHDLEWGDYLIDAKRLLHNDTLGNSIRAHAGPEILQSLKNSVQAMEVGDIPAQNAFQKAIQYLNTGTTLAGLGWNFIVSTKHPLGLFNGAARIGPKWIGVGLKRWIGDAASLQNTVEWVHDKSEFMKSRAHGRLVTRDLQDVSGKMTTGLTSDLVKQLGGAKAANALHTTGTAIEHSFYWMIERGQMIADIPTWIGQYEKSMEAHGDDAKAVQQANQAVRDSQTTGGFSDLPEIQRGGPLMKLFTKFYSYFTVVYNQLAESAEETRFRGVSNVPALAGDVMLAMILPALAGATIQRFLPGGDQRDDWAKYLGQHLLADMFGTMIGVRDMYAAFTEDKDAPSGFRFMKNTADLGKQIEQGNTNTPAFWKALNAEGGVLFHYPSATVQRFVTGMQAMADGQTHNPLVVLTGPHPKPRN